MSFILIYSEIKKKRLGKKVDVLIYYDSFTLCEIKLKILRLISFAKFKIISVIDLLCICFFFSTHC